MELPLNAPNEGTRFKEFYGPNNQQMPLLIAERRVPLSVYGLMNRRLEVLTAPEEVKFAWWENGFYTCDWALRHNDGRLKVVLGAEYSRQLGPQTELVDGAVPFTDEDYKSLHGQEFTAREVKRYFNRPLSRKEAEEHPGWRALLRDDKALQKEIVGVTFAKAKKSRKMMAVCHIFIPGFGAAGRLWNVSRRGIYNDFVVGDSWAFSDSRLDSNYSLLVGEAPETQRATLEQRV